MADLQGPWTVFHQMGRQQFSLPDRLTDQITTLFNESRKRRIQTRAKYRLEPPLMGTLGVHQNIPVSDTKLTPSLCVNFISPPLDLDKLISVNSRAITTPPKMSLLLEVELMPVVTIKPRLILVTHTDHLSRNKTFN